MHKYAAIFLIIAVFGGFLGFGIAVGMTATIAKVVGGIFFALFLVSLSRGWRPEI